MGFGGGICKSYWDVLDQIPFISSPILSLFFGDYFPMLSFLPFLFFLSVY